MSSIMIKIKDINHKYGFHVKEYTYQNKVCILTLDQEKIVLKERKRNPKDLYYFLDSKDFPYILKSRNSEKDELFEIYPFIEEIHQEKSEKAVNMMYILSLLHNKTSFYKEFSLDDKKKIYESIYQQIDYLYSYYQNLQDVIEKKVYMSPSEYMLILNSSPIYLALNYAKNTLEEWYQEVKEKKNVRYAFLHNRVETTHFLEGENSYFISWDNARRDFPIYDFLYFFKKEYQDLDMISLYQIYKHKYPFTKEEELLFFTLIAIPEKITLGRNSYNQYSKIYDFVVYLDKSRDFLLKQDKYHQKTDEKK